MHPELQGLLTDLLCESELRSSPESIGADSEPTEEEDGRSFV